MGKIEDYILLQKNIPLEQGRWSLKVLQYPFVQHASPMNRSHQAKLILQLIIGILYTHTTNRFEYF